jgi:Uncharacterized conserved protein
MEDKNLEKKIELLLQSIEPFGQTACYSVVLKEKQGDRALSFTISDCEAQALSVSIDKLKQKRPLLQDLCYMILSYYKIEILQVVVYRFYEGIFYATIVCKCGQDQMSFEARLSDAMILAIKFSAPIYTYEELLSQVGFSVSKPIQTKSPNTDLAQLESMLRDAIENENYKEAAELRDIIEKLKNK